MSWSADFRDRIARRVAEMLGSGATPAEKAKAYGELSRFYGAPGADPRKKRRRKIRQATQRRNRR